MDNNLGPWNSTQDSTSALITGWDFIGITGWDFIGITGWDFIGITGWDFIGITGWDFIGITDLIGQFIFNLFLDVCFSYKFTFERTILQHVLLIFLPSILIVMLSWISFWLDVDLSASRVALGQTSLLTLAAQFHSVQSSLPPVSTVKAIDIWMFTCIFMAFASILEYALAFNYKKRFLRQRSNQVGPKRKMKYLYENSNDDNRSIKPSDLSLNIQIQVKDKSHFMPQFFEWI
uniref:Neurotransmitter-gated ion-channel transmembrane domain-containing protein n=1 Tax=Strigamia maritima TaxID=126957 RepID=T1JP28_STRMM